MANQKMKLTNGKVDKLQAVDGKQVLVWDTEVRGFGVRISPGGSKAYIMQRRVAGKERRMTIGRSNDMSAAAARKRAMKLATKFAAGVDPVQEKQRQQSRSMTLRDAFEAYIDAPKKRGKGMTKKPQTILDIRKAMKRFDAWLDEPVTAIKGSMVRDHHRAMMQTSNAQANLAHRYLRAALNHVIADIDEDEEPILKYNPVDRLGKLHQWAYVGRRDTVIPRNKIGLWVDAVMTGLTGLKHDVQLRDVLTFLLFTGARRSEIIGDPKIPDKEPLQWSQVDLARQEVTFLNTKIGNDHMLPIGSRITKMLAERKKISRSEFVFADCDGVVPTNLRPAFTRLHDQTGVKISAHDLRRTFITAAELSVGIPEAIVRKLTNHTTGSEGRSDAHAGYLSVEIMDTRQAIQKIENWMSEQPVESEAQTASLIQFQGART